LVFTQTDDLLKPRFTTVAERQDACLELRKNFNGQESSYVRNNARAHWRRCERDLHHASRPSLVAAAKLRSNKLAEHLLASGRQQPPDVIVGEIV
jgi:hypothetical protein